MQVLVKLLACALMVASAEARPVNLPDPLLDTNAPYLRQVAQIQILRDRGYLVPTLVSSQMYATLDQALGALRASRFGSSIQPTDVASTLEENWLWWSETNGLGGVRGGEPYPAYIFIHNRTDRVISGVVVEMADRDCDFRASAAKAFHIISFSAEGTLRPNDASLFWTTISTRPEMFSSSGGGWCMTIVRAF